MNTLLSSSFTMFSTIARTFIPSTVQVRCYGSRTYHKLKKKVRIRKLNKYIKKEAKEHEQQIEESFLPPPQKIEFGLQSLATRGFLRSTKPYTPPDNVSDKILNIAKTELRQTENNELLTFKLTDPNKRFNFLKNCVAELNHDIPNSQLHKMTTVSAVIDYYKLPVSTVNSYDKMCDTPESLPPNLHLQKEPLRFNPETDTMFGGVSAFPENSVIVTGLKAKKKYKGFDARSQKDKMY